MLYPTKTALFVLCSALPLTSCVGSAAAPVRPVATETRVVMPTVPGDVLTCDVPVPSQIVMDSDVADYLTRLYGAAVACARNMQGVREILASERP